LNYVYILHYYIIIIIFVLFIIILEIVYSIYTYTYIPSFPRRATNKCILFPFGLGFCPDAKKKYKNERHYHNILAIWKSLYTVLLRICAAGTNSQIIQIKKTHIMCVWVSECVSVCVCACVCVCVCVCVCAAGTKSSEE